MQIFASKCKTGDTLVIDSGRLEVDAIEARVECISGLESNKLVSIRVLRGSGEIDAAILSIKQQRTYLGLGYYLEFNPAGDSDAKISNRVVRLHIDCSNRDYDGTRVYKKK